MTRHHRLTTAITIALVMLTSGCGSSDDTSSESDTSDPTDSTASTTTVASSDDTTTTGLDEAALSDDGDCPSATSITVTTAAGSTTVEAVASYVDILGDNDGPTNPQSATLTFANYDVTEDDARGILMPTLSGEQVLATFSIQNSGGPIAPGADYVDQVIAPDSPTQVNSTSVYTAAGRALPTEDHTITFTSVTDDQACGTITPDGDSSDRVQIDFVATRIDA